ncbi:MAG: PDZ domain-containing protein [Proteobacteria bacterium]|nr:PDZ domain-containing protein [Pseudomonadota bacterium]
MTLQIEQFFALFGSDNARARIVEIVNLVALLLLCAALASLSWRLLTPSLTPINLLPLPKETTAVSIQSGLAQIKAANLFGAAESVREQSPSQVPLSSLNLKLNGVVAAGDDSVALISVSGQPQSPFFIGDEVSHGAILDAVHPDRAILKRNGVLESLVLEDVSSSLPGSAVQTRRGRPGASIRSMGQNTYAIPRNFIDSQLSNPKFLRNATIVAHKDGGFLVKRMKKGSLYEKLGLKRGDIIKGANGQPINNIQDAMQQYQQMGSLGQIELEIKRGGQSQMLQFHLE